MQKQIVIKTKKRCIWENKKNISILDSGSINK